MTAENISWSITTKESCRPCRRGLNPWPPGLQSDGVSKWATEAGTWMVCWIANDTCLFRANCFPTDRVISNWNRCSHIHWPIYLLHWNMDQKTEIHSYIKCRIRLNIDSKQIFNELCDIYGSQTISMRTVLGGLKLLKLGNILLKMIPILEGLKPLLPRLTLLL